MDKEKHTSSKVKYAAIAALVLVLLVAGIGIYKSIAASNEPNHNISGDNTNNEAAGSEDPNTEDTNSEIINEEEEPAYGNSAGNLCNQGICEPNGLGKELGSSQYINKIGDCLFWYDVDAQTIYGKQGEQDAQALLSDAVVSYFSVTTDSFYYTLENSLYKAPRLENGIAMGKAEKLVSDISTDNSVIVEDAHAYYWREGKGLYSLNLSNGAESLLIATEATWDMDLIGKSGEWVYYYAPSAIWSVNVHSKEQKNLYQLSEDREDCAIAAGNVTDTWIYFGVTDLQQDIYLHADTIYRMRIDGSDMERIFIADSTAYELQAIGTYKGEAIQAVFTAGNGNCIYEINAAEKNVVSSVLNHGEDFVWEIGAADGNFPSNLCNDGFVLANCANKTYVYLTYADIKYSNRFGHEQYASYWYDVKTRTIMLTWNEDGKTKRLNLKEDVDCNYMYVTPDWFYCVLEEDGKNVLYRAENKPEEYAIGELKEIVTDLAIENKVAILGDAIYYWKTETGLYKAKLDGTDEKLLWSNENTAAYAGYRTFDVTSDGLYFMSETSVLYKFDFSDNKCYEIYDLRNNSKKGIISHVVADGDEIAFIVTYMEDGVRTASDEIWRLNKNETKAKRIYKMKETSQEIEAINLIGVGLYVKVEEEGVKSIHQMSLDSTDLKLLGEFKVTE